MSQYRTICSFATALTVVSSAASADTADGYSLRFLTPTAQSTSLESPAQQGFGPFETSDNPSMGRAVLYSLLLPGLGDYYSGHRTRAGYFLATEAAMWTAFAVFRVQGTNREESYIDHAERYAGLTENHTEDFYAVLRDYDTWQEYAAEIKNDARFFLGDGAAEALEAYFVENRVSDFEEWEWQSIGRRVEFQVLRSDSENAYRNAKFAIWGAVANRVVSAIVTFASFRHGDDPQVGRYQLDFTPPQRYRDYAAAMTLTRSF